MEFDKCLQLGELLDYAKKHFESISRLRVKNFEVSGCQGPELKVNIDIQKFLRSFSKLEAVKTRFCIEYQYSIWSTSVAYAKGIVSTSTPI